jgi:hypothetical protein
MKYSEFDPVKLLGLKAAQRLWERETIFDHLSWSAFETYNKMGDKPLSSFFKKYPIATSKAFLKYIIDRVLGSWTTSSDTSDVKSIQEVMPILDYLKKRDPRFSINTKKHPVAYRGTDVSMAKLKIFFKKTSSEDWQLKYIGGDPFYVYTKKKFQYKPHKLLQSWTVKSNIAKEFANYVLAAKTNNRDFYFNPELHLVGYDHEYETVHKGKNLNVILAIPEIDYIDLKDKTSGTSSKDYEKTIKKAL